MTFSFLKVANSIIYAIMKVWNNYVVCFDPSLARINS